MRKLFTRFREGMVGALVRTFAARGISSVGAFALVVVLGRLYGASGVGVYALAVSFVMGAGVFGRWGMNNALVRFVGRDTSSPKVRSFLVYACRKAAIISAIALILVYALHNELSVVFHSPRLGEVMWGMTAAIPAYVVSYILSGFLAAVHKPATACLLQNGVISFVTAVIVLLLHQIDPSIGLAGLGWAYAIAAWGALAWGGEATISWFRSRDIESCNRLDVSDIEVFRRSSSAFFATDVASFLMGIVGVWVAGYILSTHDVGLYKAGVQLANMIGMIMMVINLIIPTRFSHLYHAGDFEGLGLLARRGALAGLALAMLPLAICLFTPQLILGVVGHDFAGAALILQILAIGQLVNVGCGSVGHVLNMSGYERICSVIVWISNLVGFVMLVGGTFVFGVVGTAIGVALSQILRKLGGVYFSWRYIGIWTLPLPNLLQLMGVRGGCRINNPSVAC